MPSKNVLSETLILYIHERVFAQKKWQKHLCALTIKPLYKDHLWDCLGMLLDSTSEQSQGFLLTRETVSDAETTSYQHQYRLIIIILPLYNIVTTLCV